MNSNIWNLQIMQILIENESYKQNNEQKCFIYRIYKTVKKW